MEHPEPERNALETAKEKVTAHWDDPDAHEAFIAFAGQVHALPEAARFYRDMAAEAPERQPQVDAALKRITAQMLVTLELERARRSPTRDPKWRNRIILWACFTIAFLFLGECMRR